MPVFKLREASQEVFTKKRILLDVVDDVKLSRTQNFGETFIFIGIKDDRPTQLRVPVAGFNDMTVTLLKTI
jgi:hypothetical protein